MIVCVILEHWLVHCVTYAGLHNLYIMLKYCINEVDCRRSLIAKCFGEEWKSDDCNNHCDICQRITRCPESGASNCGDDNLETHSSTVNDDVTAHCQSLVEVIEQAQLKQQRLTAPKVIEAWKKQQKKSSKSGSSEETKCDTDSKRELILLHAIVEGVLKEEFHFTPYSTISYIGLGRKASGVKAGLLKITMRHQSDVKKKQATSSKAARGGHVKGSKSDDCSSKKRTSCKIPAGDDDFEPCAKKVRRSLKQQTEEKKKRQQCVDHVTEDEANSSGVVTIEID